VARSIETLILEISEFERVRASIEKLPVSGKGNGRYWRGRKLAEIDRQIDERQRMLGVLTNVSQTADSPARSRALVSETKDR
jgi:hypothetical protein